MGSRYMIGNNERMKERRKGRKGEREKGRKGEREKGRKKERKKERKKKRALKIIMHADFVMTGKEIESINQSELCMSTINYCHLFTVHGRDGGRSMLEI